MALGNRVVPKQLQGVIDQKTFTKANAYNIDKWNFKLLSSIVSVGQIVAAIHYDFFPYLWRESRVALATFASVTKPSEIVHSIAFASILILINTVFNIPLSLYSTFVVEARHNMNKTTIGTFVTDQITTLLLVLGIGMPVLAGFLAVVQWAGDDFAFYVWSFMVVFQLFFMMIFPSFIQPLFNKFTPLADGSLRTKIEALAKRLKFPLKKLFVVDGSKRSAHSNAYFYGFFNNKRIVIYDTLIDNSTEEEVVAVLAHELGHWHYNHVLSNLIVVQAQLFAIFYLFSLLIKLPSLYLAFGFVEKPIVVGFLLFQFVYSPVDSVMTFLMNAMTRSKEFQADAFAKKLGYAEQLKAGLIKLHTSNLSNANPDPLYSTYHHSHPPLMQR
ncbi:CAAX prenyl protease 1 [Kappamyces sp. JEL0680]|nr:CAAX prenyl protease 1 [Kappamyces sp. JEL0680]